MNTIKTATGKQFDCDYFVRIPTPDLVYMRIYNTPIATIATVFSDENELKQIAYGDIVLEGYTRLASIVPEINAIRVSVEKS